MEGRQCGDHPTKRVHLQGSLELFWLTSLAGETTAPLLRVRSSPAAGLSMPRRVRGKPPMRLERGRLRAGSIGSSLPGANSTGPDAALPLRSHVSYGGLGGFSPARCITLKTAVGKVYFGDNGAVRYRLLTCAAQAESASCRAVTVRERHQKPTAPHLICLVTTAFCTTPGTLNEVAASHLFQLPFRGLQNGAHPERVAPPRPLPVLLRRLHAKRGRAEALPLFFDANECLVAQCFVAVGEGTRTCSNDIRQVTRRHSGRGT